MENHGDTLKHMGQPKRPSIIMFDCFVTSKFLEVVCCIMFSIYSHRLETYIMRQHE